MFKNILLVAAGGAAGSVARYLMSRIVQQAAGTSFPWGTMVVNVLGCLVIGAVSELATRSGVISQDVKLILTTGFCGGFTTFSTFMNETSGLITADKPLTAALYVGASVVAGLVAVAAGMTIIKMI